MHPQCQNNKTTKIASSLSSSLLWCLKLLAPSSRDHFSTVHKWIFNLLVCHWAAQEFCSHHQVPLHDHQHPTPHHWVQGLHNLIMLIPLHSARESCFQQQTLPTDHLHQCLLLLCHLELHQPIQDLAIASSHQEVQECFFHNHPQILLCFLQAMNSYFPPRKQKVFLLSHHCNRYSRMCRGMCLSKQKMRNAKLNPNCKNCLTAFSWTQIPTRSWWYVYGF